MPTSINQQENKYNMHFCDRRKVSLKQILLQRPALGLPQLLQHLFRCSVAGSSFYYTLSAKIQIPKWQGKLKRESSCWWDWWVCYGPQQNKTWWEGKAKPLSVQLWEKFTWSQISKWIYSPAHSTALHVSVSCLGDPAAGGALPKALMH